uniref:collagen alpha-1(III) chain-like n=1 Tax=Jaculus jaculus TaxID=51337 RepID=UPI001E1B16B9|nr:collagen alpha-1(III) chain-like [Jaculus jaculus]
MGPEKKNDMNVQCARGDVQSAPPSSPGGGCGPGGCGGGRGALGPQGAEDGLLRTPASGKVGAGRRPSAPAPTGLRKMDWHQLCIWLQREAESERRLSKLANLPAPSTSQEWLEKDKT